jgi:hypothetical protein
VKAKGEARVARAERDPPSDEPAASRSWAGWYALVIGLLVLEIVLLAVLSASFRR